MSIGLFDGDFSVYKGAMFNLELMKMATYYRSRGEITALSLTLTPEKYTSFFYRKDYYDGLFPSIVSEAKNLEYGGYAFNGDLYVPLDEAIERQIPTKTIYIKYRNILCSKKNEVESFNDMLNGQHIRLSLDNKTIWSQCEKQLEGKSKLLFLHDKNLNNIENVIPTVQDLLQECQNGQLPCWLGNKFPIEVNNTKDFLAWCQFPAGDDKYYIQYNGIMEDEAVYEFVNTKKSAYSKHILYNIAGDSFSDDKLLNGGLEKIYKQVIFLRSNQMKFSLIYDNNFFFRQEWELILDLINCFAAEGLTFSKKMPIEKLLDDTMVSFVRCFDEKTKYKSRPFNRKKGQQLLGFVQEEYPELGYLFNKCCQVKYEGGKFECQ